MTHKPTGLRIRRARNIAGDRMLHIDLYGNSYTSTWTKTGAESLARFLKDASLMVHRWARNYRRGLTYGQER